MKNTWPFGILFLGCVLFSPLSNATKTLKIRSDFWCPFACDPGERPGVVMEITQKIFEKRKDYVLDYQLINWARAVADARIGVHDALVGIAVSDAPDFIFPKEALAVATFGFITLNSSDWKFTGSLSNRKIAVINSYSYDELVNKWIAEKDPHFVVISGENAQEQMAQMLKAGRVDAVYESPLVFRETWNKLKWDPALLRDAGAPKQSPQDIFIAFSPKLKNGRALARFIDQQIPRLRGSGELEKILEKYGMKDWKR